MLRAGHHRARGSPRARSRAVRLVHPRCSHDGRSIGPAGPLCWRRWCCRIVRCLRVRRRSNARQHDVREDEDAKHRQQHLILRHPQTARCLMAATCDDLVNKRRHRDSWRGLASGPIHARRIILRELAIVKTGAALRSVGVIGRRAASASANRMLSRIVAARGRAIHAIQLVDHALGMDACGSPGRPRSGIAKDRVECGLDAADLAGDRGHARQGDEWASTGMITSRTPISAPIDRYESAGGQSMITNPQSGLNRSMACATPRLEVALQRCSAVDQPGRGAHDLEAGNRPSSRRWFLGPAFRRMRRRHRSPEASASQVEALAWGSRSMRRIAGRAR